MLTTTRPLVRYGALSTFSELARALGADPPALLRASGLDPNGVAVPDRWVPADAVNDLLERTAAATGCDDFGLRMAELRRLSHLGPLSLVLREEPDVRSALDLLIRHERMYTEVVRTRVAVADGVATVRVDIELERPAPDRQAVDLAVGALYGLLRELIGPNWSPLSVSFGHPPPTRIDTARRMFRGALHFDADHNGVRVPAGDLDRAITTSDPQLREYTRRLLDGDAGGRDSTARIRELVDVLLPTGRCSVEQVARSLGVDRRTLHRRLAAEGTTFTEVVDDTRAALARRLVAGRTYSFAEIAGILAFSSPSNFSRWFRARFGTTPRQWRRDAQSGGER